jgi:predicted phage-related endonuclease
MAMTRYTDEPGSAAWHARRARCFNAGDASAMLGCHPSGKTRTQLLEELHTGIEREFSDYVQEKVINPGHRIEALWRPIAEQILGEDLQVLSGSLDVGLSRPLGASLDAVTFMEDTLGECKSANEALRAALPHTGRDSHARNDARQLPKGYRTQLEQQQMVTGATRTLFSACQFDADGNVTEERHAFYNSDRALRAEILAGWKQFATDLAAYVPPAASAVEKIVAEPVQALPSVSVKVEGSIVIHENFDAFEVAMRDFLEHRLIREPRTDQQFADLEMQIKAMKGAEAALDNAEDSWIAQIETVSQKKRRKDMLKALVRDNRLLSEKLMASEKERRRGEIVAGGVKALADHIAALNKRLGKAYMPTVQADFGGCIKGMKSLASMEDRVATELARAKIVANEIADRVDANLKALRELASEHAFLFADTAIVVLKAPDDCLAVITSRIGEHRAAEERRLDAERARIRQEEEERARQQQERRAQVQARIDGIKTAGAGVTDSENIARAIRTLQSCTLTEALLDDRVAEAAQARVTRLEQLEIAHADAVEREQAAARAEQERQQQTVSDAEARAVQPHQPQTPVLAAVAGPAVIPMPTRAPAAPSGPPTLKLGDIRDHLHPFQIDAAGLEALGFPPAGREGAAKLYHQADLPLILTAAIQHLTKVRDQLAKAA